MKILLGFAILTLLALIAGTIAFAALALVFAFLTWDLQGLIYHPYFDDAYRIVLVISWLAALSLPLPVNSNGR